ncbi:hypothetical protein BO443_30052 [Burkholderia orbicola]
MVCAQLDAWFVHRLSLLYWDHFSLQNIV